jgi:succinate dehydrogenase/fumarate reductase flavoprotein subunit
MLVRNPVTGVLDRLPSFMVFDETTRRAGPIGRQRSGQNREFQWSSDNTSELAAGWITSGGSWSELAGGIGVPAHELERTAAAFNRAAARDDDTWGRPARLMIPLATPPYYAIPLWPVLLNTAGGPRRDAACRILGADGAPIPGLFGAGELGSIWGAAYPGAVSVAEALISGRRAATSAVESVRKVTTER